jgi:Type IV secretion system pilin
MSTKTRNILVKVSIWAICIGGLLFALAIPTTTVRAATGTISVDNVCSDGKLGGCSSGVKEAAGVEGVGGYILNTIVPFIQYIGVAISVFYILWGGYIIMSSSGGSGSIDKGREYIRNAVIGMVIILASVLIAQVSAYLITSFTK